MAQWGPRFAWRETSCLMVLVMIVAGAGTALVLTIVGWLLG